MQIADPADGEAQFIELATGKVWPRFTDSIGGKEVLDRALAALGAGGTGPIRARLVIDGVAGEWLPVADVVRLPAIEALSCGRKGACTLAGERLFLIAAVAPAADFAGAKPVPPGYVETKLEVPAPSGDTLYPKLHDAPDAVIRVTAKP